MSEQATSSINAPHSNEPDPDDFFGEPAEPAEGSTAEQGPPEPEPAPDPGEQGGGQDKPEVEGPPIDEHGSQPPAEPTDQQAPPEGDAPPTSMTADPNAPRDYKIFQEVKLTRPVLEGLLEELAESAESEPRDAFFLLDTIETKTSKTALQEAYLKHKESFGGTPPRLVAVTERQFHPRTVKPKQQVRESLDIS